MKKELKLRDTVRFSSEWLRSTGSHSNEMAQAKGTIVGLVALGSTTLALVEWDKPDLPDQVGIDTLEPLS